ncbi:MAG: serine/threonine-protein kinase [Granulosicoccus sp.]
MNTGTEFPEIPGYELTSVLGVGGFATVYLAKQISLNREVALKVMDRQLTADPDFHRRFLREARDMALVCNHPNIATIFDVDQTTKHLYLAMQYLPEPNLREKIEGFVTFDTPITMVLRIAAALDHVHSKGMVHRDIKPANILFNESNQAMLGDFGIAKNLTNSTMLTQLGTILGTTRYMSPEQCRGDEAIDCRSDLYSLGVVLFESLALEPPYQCTDQLALMNKHLSAPIPKLPNTYDSIQPVIEKLMAKCPSDRYQSAQQLIQELQQLQDIPLSDPPLQLQSSLQENKSKHVVGWGIAGLLLMGSTIGALLFQQQHLEPFQECGVLSQEQTTSRDVFLELASVYESVGRTDYPPGANALHAFSEAVKIDSCNEFAVAAVKRLSKDRSAQLP